jgi:CheY-like chemotaxis protein
MAVPSKRILLVEESGVCRHFLPQLLSCLGYAVTEATTGLDGIYKAAIEIPDLIMMGADLPQLTGIEVTDWLKHHPYTKDIPVLIYAPSPTPGGEDDACKAGASAVINDPITVDALRKAFQLCFLSQKETLRDLGDDSKMVQPPNGRYL